MLYTHIIDIESRITDVHKLDNFGLRVSIRHMNAAKFNELLGKTLRVLRNSKGWTQQEFAVLTGLSRGTIANMETGRQAMSAHQAFLLASTLDLRRVDELYPLLPVVLEGDEDEIKIHRSYQSSELNDLQLKQVQALARAAG